MKEQQQQQQNQDNDQYAMQSLRLITATITNHHVTIHKDT